MGSSAATTIPLRESRDLQAVASHAQLLAAIQQAFDNFGDKIDNFGDKIDNFGDRVGGQIDNLSTQIAASNHNDMARLQNSHINAAHHHLEPLHHALTNQSIPEFPLAPADISSASAARARDILIALNMNSEGTVAQMRQRVRQLVGLNPFAG